MGVAAGSAQRSVGRLRRHLWRTKESSKRSCIRRQARGTLSGMGPMSEPRKLTSIECAQCAAVIEVYLEPRRDQPNLRWLTWDKGCKFSRVERCPYARTEVERLYPDLM